MLATWEAGYRLIGWKAYVFPAPSHLLDALLDMLNVPTYFGEPLHKGWPWTPEGKTTAGPAPSASVLQAPLLEALLISGLRVVGGFLLSLLLGLLLGLLMWRFAFWDELFGPVFLGLQTLPSVCWVPLAILIYGISETAILFVMVMGSFFAIALSLRDGLRTIPPIYHRAGLMLGAKGWKLYRYVLLPASLPALAGSLRVGFSFAWRSLMGAEFIFMLERHGLGFLLYQGRDIGGVAYVLAVMGVMVMVGMVVDRLAFARLEKRIRARFGLEMAT